MSPGYKNKTSPKPSNSGGPNSRALPDQSCWLRDGPLKTTPTGNKNVAASKYASRRKRQSRFRHLRDGIILRRARWSTEHSHYCSVATRWKRKWSSGPPCPAARQGPPEVCFIVGGVSLLY